MYFRPLKKQKTMSRGKTTCKVLKEVRRKIADANGIPLQERECTHTGDCAGTCPYCESEVRYLERELSKRKSLGKALVDLFQERILRIAPEGRIMAKRAIMSLIYLNDLFVAE